MSLVPEYKTDVCPVHGITHHYVSLTCAECAKESVGNSHTTEAQKTASNSTKATICPSCKNTRKVLIGGKERLCGCANSLGQGKQ